MSDTVSIERNGIAKTFIKKVFGKKSKNAGKEFFAPEIDVSQQDDVTWFGLGDINKVVNNWLRVTFMGIHVDSISDKRLLANGQPNPNFGIFNWAEWKESAEEFTKGVQKLSDLEAEISEYQDIQSGLVDRMQDSPDEVDAIMVEMKTNNDYIKTLKAAASSIKEKYALIRANRVANAAKTAEATA